VHWGLKWLVLNNKTSTNHGSKRRKKELGTEMSRICRVKADRHLQIIGSKLYKRQLMAQCNEKKKHII
jgi:hypothetical protein